MGRANVSVHGRLGAYTIGILSTHLIRYALVVVILRTRSGHIRVYLRCRCIIVLLYIKGVQMERPMGSKGLADAFSRTVLKASTRGTVVYMISTFLAPYSWLNGVALALVPPRGARYWSRGEPGTSTRSRRGRIAR